MNRSGQTVCLNMIVRDEAPVIARCLASVRPLIDSWLIVDTGSTDGTQGIVRELLADLPGELVERPWRDFGANRTEALQLARGRADYVLFIDADEVVELDAGFALPRLTADAYVVTVALDGCTHPRRQLVRAALDWRYEGVLHERIVCEQAREEAELAGVRTIAYQDGARSRDPSTPRRDALLLEEALIDDPGNARYVLALAERSRDAGDLEAALRHYRRRAEMPGPREQTWYALYQIALVEDALGHPWGEVLEAYLAAFELVPDRAEPLFGIGLRYRQQGRDALAHTFLARAMQIPPPGADRLHVERPVYEYLLGMEYAAAAGRVGDHAAAVATCNALLRGGRLPAGAVPHVVATRRASLNARHPRNAAATVGRVLVDERSAAPDDVIVLLPPGHELAGPRSIAAVRRAFEDVGCALLYGPDGEPAASAAEHDERGPALAAGSALCFRASLHADAPPDRFALWSAAGFERTRFLDDPITALPRGRPAITVAGRRETHGERPPAISCLMVTRDRLALAKRAIRCFADQTHPERELVIVSEGERDYRAALERYIDQQGIEHARVVRAEPGVPLGHLRNMTLDEAAGPIVCQWDDDDCSHPNRLAEQWEAMEREGADACFLIDHLQYLEQDRLIFWIDWTMSGALTDEWQLFPGTVMMRRDERFRYPEEGPYARHGEDSVMVDQLWHNVNVARVGGMGHLYLYHFHGKNTFSRDHHLHITTCAGTNERIEAMADQIREAVSYYEVPKPIPVLGASGPVFVVG